jgi:hypothetical protein
MKHNVIRYGMIVLLIGLTALTASRTHAQTQSENEFVFLGASFGMSTGQMSRITAYIDGSMYGPIRTNEPVIVRIQLLDAEGKVIAQSDEMRVEPGKFRFWDAPRELLPAGESTGRIQVRPRILITTSSFDVDRSRAPLAATVEIIDQGTGRTVSFFAHDGFVGGVTVASGSMD